MRVTLLALPALSVLAAAAAAQNVTIDPNTHAPVFGIPLQGNDSNVADHYQRLPYRDLAGETDDKIEAGHQHPIDAGPRRDHAPIAAAEQRKGEAHDEQRKVWQGRAERARCCGRIHAGGAQFRDLPGGFSIHQTRRCRVARAAARPG